MCSNCSHLMSMFLDECGIVAQISQPLADSDISAYYISTFSFDHALVSPCSSSSFALSSLLLPWQRNEYIHDPKLFMLCLDCLKGLATGVNGGDVDMFKQIL